MQSGEHGSGPGSSSLELDAGGLQRPWRSVKVTRGHQTYHQAHRMTGGQ